MFPTTPTEAVTPFPGPSGTALTAGPIQRSVSVFANTSHPQHPVFGISAFGTIVASVKQEKPAATTHFSPSHTSPSTSTSTPAAGFAALGSSSIEYSKPLASSSSSTVAASRGFARFSSLDELVVNRDVSTGPDRLSRCVSGAPGQFDQLPQTFESQKTLKDVVTPRLTNSQALFYFGVLATKANLNPRFTFKHGFQHVHRVGVLLIFYGHTISIETRYATARGAKAAACRQALAELREYNPQWPLPAEPTEGRTDVAWNWTQLLEEHCAQNGLPGPKYIPRHEFYCDVLINGEKLSTCRQCISLHEAQQTVAHVAFHQLLV
ncbi:hypothetical protein N7474_010505 [Penicillium riverlandense]|uniref:uncharacterized protein n=1 Tax=Penicillium riverlandense TaxID=1903569 RepID=UPI002547810D|nr:uncharacterized protein N7474_010505 [Penicillium riverlandense]KAJ5806913.1 hypothetical protein N7474_010505 [Penicillium riverlandense]